MEQALLFNPYVVSLENKSGACGTLSKHVYLPSVQKCKIRIHHTAAALIGYSLFHWFHVESLNIRKISPEQGSLVQVLMLYLYYGR